MELHQAMILLWGLVFTFIITNPLLCSAVVSVPFSNCGIFPSLVLNETIIENCEQDPCIFHPGDTMNVKLLIIPKYNEEGRVDLPHSLNTAAHFEQWGQKWQCSVTPTDPCLQWNCPLRAPEGISHSESPLSYSFQIEIASEIKFKRPGWITVLVDDNHVHLFPKTARICSHFKIEIR